MNKRHQNGPKNARKNRAQARRAEGTYGKKKLQSAGAHLSSKALKKRERHNRSTVPWVAFPTLKINLNQLNTKYAPYHLALSFFVFFCFSVGNAV
jgi:hypothetical protein